MKKRKWKSIIYRVLKNKNFFANYVFSRTVSNCLADCGDNLELPRDAYIDGEEYIHFGKNVIIQSGLRMEAVSYYQYSNEHFSPRIEVGDYVSIGRDCHIGAINKVIIKEGVLLGSKVYITDHQHGKTTHDDMCKPPRERALYSKGPVIIEKNVWIGDNVVIMPDVTVGEGAIIAANAVVTKNVPAYSVVAGVPASIIKECVEV